MTQSEFETIVAEEFEHIPEKFRKRIHNVALLVEDEPDQKTREENGLERGDTLLGLYRGVPAIDRGDLYGVGETLPDTITIYRYSVLAEARESGLAVRQVVFETLWHEIAHYFGYEEDEVHRRERERHRGS